MQYMPYSYKSIWGTGSWTSHGSDRPKGLAGTLDLGLGDMYFTQMYTVAFWLALFSFPPEVFGSPDRYLYFFPVV